MPAFPIERYLTPDPEVSVPEGFESANRPISMGLPFTFDLSGGLQGILVLPTGLAKDWAEADPSSVVSQGADERTSVTRANGPLPLNGRVPLRLIVRKSGVILGSVPVSLGVIHRVGDTGSSERGLQIEVCFLDWKLCSGSVRGPGNYGSFVNIAWRIADKAIDLFGPPPISMRVYERLPPMERIESHGTKLKHGHKHYHDHKKSRRRKAR